MNEHYPHPERDKLRWLTLGIFVGVMGWLILILVLLTITR